MSEKTGRNDPCPCGSGKKLKKCCQSVGRRSTFTREERHSAYAKLDRFIEDALEDELDDADDEFWVGLPGAVEALGDERLSESAQVFDLWFAFDRPLTDGRLPVDAFLEEATDVTTGERTFLLRMCETSMRLYEVVDLSPGVSIRLRDVVERQEVTVRERSLSRTIDRHEWLAARVNPRGASGEPEIDAGALPIPRLIRDGVSTQLKAARERFLSEYPGAPVAAFYKQLAPFFHEAWVTMLIDPPVPELKNTDGEDLLETRVTFEVLDVEQLQAALGSCAALERDDDGWHWVGENKHGKPVVLGRIEPVEGDLLLEANSAARGERGRALLEGLAGGAIRHRRTTHENLSRKLKDELRDQLRSGEPNHQSPALPPALNEALVLNHLGRYYRGWLDEAIPALEGRTPRSAAREETLKPKLAQLIRDLEGQYTAALRQGEPAYDPTWMWTELGFEDPYAATHPPPLAHERLAQILDGAGELVRETATELRAAPAWDDSTVVDEDAFRTLLKPQRFIRERTGTAADPAGREQLATLLRLAVNHELHRRKSFWVDEALAYTLEKTDVDVLGRELRLPFPSFVLVFTDRNMLSLAERLAATLPEAPLAGHLVRVLTTWVTEARVGEARALELAFALDTLGSDPPFVVRHRLILEDGANVQTWIDQVAPAATDDPSIADVNPLRALLRTTVNAILYATSAGVEPRTRTPPQSPPERRRQKSAPVLYSSEEVYFLPGAIEISALRRLQALDRIPDGRAVVRRFMVRGHWRRASANWADQRMRWIAPHWKGPDMAPSSSARTS